MDCFVVFCAQTLPGMANCSVELKPAAAHASVLLVSVMNAARSKSLYAAVFSWPAAHKCAPLTYGRKYQGISLAEIT